MKSSPGGKGAPLLLNQYRLIQNFLIVGILLFTVGIIVTYNKIESINYVGRELWSGSTHNIRDNPGRGGGSERGRIKCDEDISNLVSYWNDPRSEADRQFQSPFQNAAYTTKPNRTRYLSFEPDPGGWNNIRMAFEIQAVLAAATGRTLILPPDNPLYLLYKDKGSKHKGIQKFFQPFDDVVNTITTEEFFQREVLEKKSYPLPSDEKNRTKLLAALQKCNWMAKAQNSCFFLYEYLSTVADFVPDWHGEHHCLIMDDEHWFRDDIGDNVIDAALRQRVQKFCSKQRKPVYYDEQMHDAPLLHLHSHDKHTRLLVHFYSFVYFTNPKVDNYYKRLVRDRVRYSDEIFCAAGKIVKSLIEESANGAGDHDQAGYFSMHIRRGDFQWPKMRIPAEEWYQNTRNWLEPDRMRLLYIATDEKDRTFFDPLREHYRVRFLDDYSKLAGLSDLDPNFVGMIDQIVASRSRTFVGTYFSSFSAYIGRMRGYSGVSDIDMFYGQRSHWNETHSWVYPHASYSAREFPLGWVGIDENYEQDGRDFH